MTESIDAMSVKQLKEFLAARQIDYSHCIEKSEIVTLAKANAHTPLAGPKINYSELFGSQLVTKTGSVNTQDHLQGKYVLLYFSAHWCPPCRAFTPQLAQWYQAARSQGVELEIIFVSMDHNQSGFDSYFGTMPWAAIPFGQSELKQKLSSRCSVQGIPQLSVFDKDLTLITNQGREKLMSSPGGFPWK